MSLKPSLSQRVFGSTGLCIFLSLAEAIAFIMVAIFAAMSTQTGVTPSAVAALFLPQLGNLIIAIATTWYVVFTHDILQATEASMRIQAQPFLRISWHTEGSCATISVPEAGFLSERVREAITESGLAIHSNPPRQFVTVSFQNQRISRIGGIRFAWKAEILKPESAINLMAPPISGTFRRDGLEVGQAQSIKVTLLETTGIPYNQKISITVSMLEYLGTDSNVALSDFFGEPSYEVSGNLLPSSFAAQDGVVTPEAKV